MVCGMQMPMCVYTGSLSCLACDVWGGGACMRDYACSFVWNIIDVLGYLSCCSFMFVLKRVRQPIQINLLSSESYMEEQELHGFHTQMSHSSLENLTSEFKLLEYR